MFRFFFKYGSNFARLKIDGKTLRKKQRSNSWVNELINHYQVISKYLLECYLGQQVLEDWDTKKYFWSLLSQLAWKKELMSLSIRNSYNFFSWKFDWCWIVLKMSKKIFVEGISIF